MARYLTRKKSGKGFKYFHDGVQVDNDTADRIDALAIPPAWTDVRISVSKSAKVQATGYDAKSRKQYIYHPTHRQKQEALKFDRTIQFATRLPRLRRQIDNDIRRRRFDKRKVLASAIKLMDAGYFRVGNKTYAQENDSYGLTTLRSKHVSISGSQVVFDFMGKSAQKQHKVIRDAQLARIIAKLDEMPGYELFRYYDSDGTLHNLDSSDVNAYIKEHMGADFSAKDFRTWGGTMLAAVMLVQETKPDSETARKKAMGACIKKVARKLGNTPAIAKKSYIDPRIFTAFDSHDELGRLYTTMQDMRPKKYLSNDERWVLQILGRTM